MQTKLKGGLRTDAHVGIVGNLGMILRKVTAIRFGVFHEGIAAGMFTANCLPYEASESYRVIKTELECRRSQIQMYKMRTLSS